MPDAVIEEKFWVLSGVSNEAQARLWAAAEARSRGRGGVSAVARATGLSRTGGPRSSWRSASG